MNQGLVVPGSWGPACCATSRHVLGALSIAAVESRMDEERQFQLALLSREAQRLLAQASPREARARPPVPKPKP